MSNKTKDKQYFTHDSDASMDPKIIALIATHRVEGYGRFWLLIEFLRRQPGYKYDTNNRFSWASLADVLKFNIADCKQFIEDCIKEFDLLKNDNGVIWSQSLCDRMKYWDEKRQKLSDRGKKGAEVTNGKKAAQAAAQANENAGTSKIDDTLSAENDIQNPAIDKKRIDKKINNDSLPIGKGKGKGKGKEKPADVTQYWKTLTQAWFDFFNEKFRTNPTFEIEEGGALKKIARRLKAKSKEENLIWTEERANEKFKNFLNEAYSDAYMRDNFLLPQIARRFDKYYSIKPNGNTTAFHQPGGKQQASASAIGKLQGLKSPAA